MLVYDTRPPSPFYPSEYWGFEALERFSHGKSFQYFKMQLLNPTETPIAGIHTESYNAVSTVRLVYIYLKKLLEHAIPMIFRSTSPNTIPVEIYVTVPAVSILDWSITFCFAKYLYVSAIPFL